MRIANRSLSFQLAMGIAGLCLSIIGGISAWSYKASEKAAIIDVKNNLTQDAQMLSAFVESVYLGELGSAERLMKVFESVLGGPISVATETMKTGNAVLPIVRANGRILNGNVAILEEMERRIGKTGVGLQIVHEGKVYRILTTNKDKEGNYLFGALVPAEDPLATAALSGKTWQGLVFRAGKPRATVAKPILDASGKSLGVLAITLDVETAVSRLAEKINQIKVGHTGYVYALAPAEGSGKFVIHPSMVGKDISEVPENSRAVLKEVLQKTSGTVQYMWPDDKGNEHLKMVAFQEVPGLGWKVVTGSLVAEFVEQVTRQALLSAVFMGIGLIFICAVLALFIRARLAPIQRVVESFNAIGNGDLTTSIPLRDKASINEIDILSNHAAETIDRIRTVVSSAKAAADKVSAASKDSELAASQAEKIASHLGDQAHAMASNVEEVSVAIDQVAESSSSVSMMTELVSQHAHKGVSEALSFQKELVEIARGISSTAENIQLLGNRSMEIGTIVQVIQDIAAQTNLLALNAAIEAARAGEAGRGFAVVADEVRKLADNTSRSADEIHGVVTAIQSQTAEAVGSIGKLSEEIKTSTGQADVICASLEEINKQAHETSIAVTNISNATKEQSVAVHDIARGVEQIARLSEESSHHSKASLDATAQMGQMAESLDNAMGIFKL